MSTLRRTVLVAALALVGAAPMSAQTIYSSRASWLAASTGVTTESFDAVIPFYNFSSGLNGPWDASGLGSTFNHPGSIVPGLRIGSIGGSGNYLFIGRQGDFGSLVGNATDGFVGTNQNIAGVKLAIDFLSGPVTSAGFDYYNPFTAGALLSTIDVYGGATLIGSYTYAPSATGAFFGITSGKAITRMTLQNFWYPRAGENIDIADNIAFGTAAAVTSTPEPATFALLGGGLLTLGAIAVGRRARRPS